MFEVTLQIRLIRLSNLLRRHFVLAFFLVYTDEAFAAPVNNVGGGRYRGCSEYTSFYCRTSDGHCQVYRVISLSYIFTNFDNYSKISYFIFTFLI